MYVLSINEWSRDTAQYWIGYPQMIEYDEASEQWP